MSVAVAAEPTWHTAPDYALSYGEEVADLGRMIGYAPHPEQEAILEDVFAVDADGRVASFENAMVTPRQQMKTGALKLCAIGWLYVTDQRLVVWSAHEFGTAQEAFRDIVGLIEGSDFLSRRVKAIHTGNGDESVELHGDRRLIFKARTSGGGRGLTGDKVILDEAFALQPMHMGALLPTLIAVEDPQVVYASSAGAEKSAVLRGVRDRGRAGSRRLSYTEFAAPERECASEVCQHAAGYPGCAYDDMDLWRAACVVTARRDPERMEIIAQLRLALTPEEFAREILGWWEEPLGEAPIDALLWLANKDPKSKIPGHPVLALDVSPKRDWSCLVAGGKRGDGRIHVEVTGRQDVPDYRPGVAWLGDRLRELKTRGFREVWIAAGSAAEGLAPTLTQLGMTMRAIPNAEVSAACGRFYDNAVGRRLAHLGQPPLDSAIPATRKRDIADKAFVWSRRGGADITPTYAATVAAWVAERHASSAPNIW